MVHYRRNPIPGARFFFTVVLADRRSRTLTDNIAALREAFRKIRSERPFEIDAIVILPEHLHTILTLPDGDADFPRRCAGSFAKGCWRPIGVAPAATTAILANQTRHDERQ